MTSYNLLNGTHTAENRGLIEAILRAEYGYEVIVMTDWVTPMSGDARSANRDSQAQYVAAAGGDLFMPGNKGDYDNLLQGIDSGAVTLEQVKINASRVVKMCIRDRPCGLRYRADHDGRQGGFPLCRGGYAALSASRAGSQPKDIG